VTDKKVAPQDAEGQPTAPDGATSGEYVRQTNERAGAFSSQSTTRRALSNSGARTAERRDVAPLPRSTKGASKAEEQTQPSARAPQRVRVSLRMRRAAAGAVHDSREAPGPDDRVALRLAGRLFELLPGTVAVVGRAPECEVVLDARLCSRRHAELSRADNGAVTVRDLQSSNGTYINGIRINAARALALGDWITIGNETFELCISEDARRLAAPTIPVGPGKPSARNASLGSKTKTDPGSPLLALASFTAIASSRTPAPIEPDLVKRPLEVLLRQIEEGQALDPAAPSMATSVALRIARATRDAQWVSYCFRLHTALRLPMSLDLIERVRETLALVRQPEAGPFEAYLKVLGESAGSGQDEGQQRLILQVGELRAFFR
jgi:hypothetical protein